MSYSPFSLKIAATSKLYPASDPRHVMILQHGFEDLGDALRAYRTGATRPETVCMTLEGPSGGVMCEWLSPEPGSRERVG